MLLFVVVLPLVNVDGFHEPYPERNPAELCERAARHRGSTSNNGWGRCIAILILEATESAAYTQPASYREHDDHECRRIFMDSVTATRTLFVLSSWR